jgi:hypothetical protein
MFRVEMFYIFFARNSVCGKIAIRKKGRNFA